MSGTAMATAGTGLCVAGMSRFTGPGQVSGTDPATVVADGVYRISRNPQYLGYLAALTGLSVARRSPVAMALTAAAAVVYQWWVPIEERHLSTAFGTNYDHYRERTPRWLGLAHAPPAVKHFTVAFAASRRRLHLFASRRDVVQLHGG